MSSGDAPQAVVRIKTGEEWSAFVTRLRRPTAAAKQVGALLVRTSQKAFRAQALGDFHWKPRSVYARSPASGKKYLVNIAGMLADFRQGKQPPERRFTATPALVDTNELRRSIASKETVAEYRAEVVVGSVRPYAGKHQGGGVENIPITQSMKAALAKWMKAQRGAAARHAKTREHGPLQEKDAKRERKVEHREGVADAVGFLLHMDVWHQRIPARPFVGVPPEAEDKIRRLFARNVAEPDGGGAAPASP